MPSSPASSNHLDYCLRCENLNVNTNNATRRWSSYEAKHYLLFILLSVVCIMIQLLNNQRYASYKTDPQASGLGRIAAIKLIKS